MNGTGSANSLLLCIAVAHIKKCEETHYIWYTESPVILLTFVSRLMKVQLHKSIIIMGPDKLWNVYYSNDPLE